MPANEHGPTSQPSKSHAVAGQRSHSIDSKHGAVGGNALESGDNAHAAVPHAPDGIRGPKIATLVSRRLDDIEHRLDRKLLGILDLLKKMNAAVASSSGAPTAFV